MKPKRDSMNILIMKINVFLLIILLFSSCSKFDDNKNTNTVNQIQIQEPKIITEEKLEPPTNEIAIVISPEPITNVIPEKRTIKVSTAPLQKVLGSNDIALVAGLPVTADEFYKIYANEQLEKLPNFLKKELFANRKKFIEERLINSKIFEYAANLEDFSNNPNYQKEVEAAVAEINKAFFYEKFIKENVNVSESDLKKYYENHKLEYVKPEMIRARHILVSIPQNSYRAQIDLAQKKINNIKQRIREGEAFELVAAAESDCLSKTSGGDLGYFSRGKLAKPIENAAFKMAINDISDVIETEFGYHIIQITDKIPQKMLEFNDIKTDIRTKVEEIEEQKLYDELLSSLTNKFEVIRNEKLINQLINY